LQQFAHAIAEKDRLIAQRLAHLEGTGHGVVASLAPKRG
jgi:hypothetical protein